MGESKRQKHKSRLGVICAVLLAVLLIYFAYQIFGKSTASVSVMKTQLVTDENYINMHGYVYRSEELIYADDGQFAELLVPNGEKIPVGKDYMKLYNTSGLSETRVDSIRDELDDISDRIDALTKSFDHELRVQDLGEVNASLSNAYYAFISSVADNNYPAASVGGEQLLDFMNQQQMITGKLASLKDSLSELVAKKNELIEKYATGSGVSVENKISCNVYRDIDGYEDSFAYGDVMTMSVEDFREGISNIKTVYHKNAVAKRVLNSKWYLVVPITVGGAELFEVGVDYNMVLSEISDKNTVMTVERIEIPEGEQSGFMVLSSREIGKSFDISRYTSVKYLRTSISGFRVPESAIHELDRDGDGHNEYIGVYVMSGNYAKFRRIKVISYGEGYVIVSESDEVEEDEFPYLSQSELIIVSGGNLYDGKLIK